MTVEKGATDRPLKIGILVDDLKVAKWQADALSCLAEDCELIVYSCANSCARPRKLRHSLYYALNLVAIRSELTRSVPLAETGKSFSRIGTFQCEYDGQWQRLPSGLLDEIRSDSPDLILKFGMGLMRVPPEAELSCPILSYHHGDPDHYRGRPAGFYEMMQGRGTVGQIVQILGNRLDAGEVVAFGETKVHPHSYRATLREAFRHSRLLINTAVRNVMAGRTLGKPSTGRNYRLPGNGLVILFLLKMLRGWVSRLFYGGFILKEWKVSVATFAPGGLIGADDKCAFPPIGDWRHLPVPEGYRFIADPFFHPDEEGVLVEAMPSGSAKGQILHIDPNGIRCLSDPTHHHSYPFTFVEGEDRYLVPEISDWSPPRLFRLEGGSMRLVGPLGVAGGAHILDPSLVRIDDDYFLFANLTSEGNNILRLWWSDRLTGDYREHPLSPVRISPVGARMAGAILDVGGSRVRLGQDASQQYGDGIILFRIDELSRTGYREEAIGSLRFDSVKGPHTLNFRGNEAVFDWYRERFTLRAGAQRLRALAQSRDGASPRTSRQEPV